MGRDEIADRLSAFDPPVLDPQIRPHLGERRQQPGAERVQANGGQGHGRARHEQGGDDRECGGGRVGGHRHVPGQQLGLATQQDHAPGALLLDAHLRAEMTQHVLAMVPGRLRFLDPRDAARVQPRQQERRLYLRGRDRQAVVERQRLARALHGQRQSPSSTGGEARAARGQRVGDAAHGAPAQGRVARHHREQRMARQDAAQQPRRRAGIAHVEHVCGLDQAADAAAGDAPGAFAVTHDLGAKRPHGGGCPQHVLTIQQAGDPGLADSQRPEHQRAMADRLVARVLPCMPARGPDGRRDSKRRADNAASIRFSRTGGGGRSACMQERSALCTREYRGWPRRGRLPRRRDRIRGLDV